MYDLESAIKITVKTVCDMQDGHIDRDLVSYYASGAINAMAALDDRPIDIIAYWVQQDVIEERQRRKARPCN